MLQHNAARAGNQAHIAHAAMVTLHALCCGLPALAMLAAAASGAASGVVVLSDFIRPFHDFLHGQEAWVLVLSGLLVAIGGALELEARRRHRRGFPWLFAVSAGCFLINVGIIAVHWAG